MGKHLQKHLITCAKKRLNTPKSATPPQENPVKGAKNQMVVQNSPQLPPRQVSVSKPQPFNMTPKIIPTQTAVKVVVPPNQTPKIIPQNPTAKVRPQNDNHKISDRVAASTRPQRTKNRPKKFEDFEEV